MRGSVQGPSSTCPCYAGCIFVLGEKAYRRLMAASNCQGILVAPKTKTPSISFPTPFICTKNSVLTRREASLSPSPREPHRESTSSIKMMAGLDSRAIWNSCLTSLYNWAESLRLDSRSEMVHEVSYQTKRPRRNPYLSDSPIHLETKSEEETEKKVELASVATALAKNDLPVPGGP